MLESRTPHAQVISAAAAPAGRQGGGGQLFLFILSFFLFILLLSTDQASRPEGMKKKKGRADGSAHLHDGG